MGNVYLVFFELSGSSGPFSGEGFAGAFVTCIVRADDIRSALDIAEHALRTDNYIVLDIDKAMRFEPQEWQHDEDIMRAAAGTTEDGLVRYSAFTVWGH